MANIQPAPLTSSAADVPSANMSDASPLTSSPEAMESSKPETPKLSSNIPDAPQCEHRCVPGRLTASRSASITTPDSNDVPGPTLSSPVINDSIPQPSLSSPTFSKLPCSTEEFDFAMAVLRKTQNSGSVDHVEFRDLYQRAMVSISASSAGDRHQIKQRADRLAAFVTTCNEIMEDSIRTDLELARLRWGPAAASYMDNMFREVALPSINGADASAQETNSDAVANRTNATESGLLSTPVTATDDIAYPAGVASASVIANYNARSTVEPLARWRSLLEDFVEQARARGSRLDQLTFEMLLEMIRFRELVSEPDTASEPEEPVPSVSSPASRDEFLAASLVPAPELEGTGECPICTDLFEKAVRTPCGHEFCAACLTRWLRDNATCPIDRTELFQPCQTSPAAQPPDDDEDDADDSDFDELEYTFDELCIEPFSDQRDFVFHFHNEDVVESQPFSDAVVFSSTL